MNNRRVLVNAVSSVLSYGFLFVFSIISSRFVLVGYGSETNGLLSSVNQIFSYLALFEAGIGTATIRALYQPVTENDKNGICNILSASKSYYRRCTIWYFACVVIVSFIWPIIIDTNIPFLTIWAIIFLQGVSGVITFWFTSTATNYLVASGRNYVNNNLHVFTTLTSSLLKILICVLTLNIVFISISLIAINIAKCLIYHIYLKKHCPEYFLKRKPNRSLLQQRNSFLVHEISGVIFASTDTIILSVFCGLNEASIYAVYALVVNAVKTIIGQVFSGTNYILGSSFAKNRKDYLKVHDTYNCVYISGVFALYSIVYLLLIPFISIYTKGITDVAYIDEALPILFIVIELLSACRIVDSQLIKTALHAKQTVSRSLIEAGINLIVSLIAVYFIGIYGVLLGTIVALLYRSNDIVLYANKHILKRKPIKEYIIYGVNFVIFIGIIKCSGFLAIEAVSFLQLISIALPVGIIIILGYAIVNYVLYRIMYD